jgi:HNH/Endo VII superfamily nuclease toxin with a HHH motif/Domain of unknown function (DUF4157)
MTRQNAIQTQQQATGTSPLSKGGILQRQCESCGQHTIAGGECTDCGKKKKIGLQRKLTIGASNDPLELEADRVADRVMAASPNSVVSSAPLSIQRFTGQTAGQTEMVAPASVESVLSSPGSPLELGLQEDMSQRFGHDFSRVRVHTGDEAARSARDVNASAYTVGNDIVFGAGQFAPSTYRGQRLVAHELTHVLQQGDSIHNLMRAIPEETNLTPLNLPAEGVEMPWIGKGANASSSELGYLRDKQMFWREFERLYPGRLGSENLTLVRGGNAPKVNQHWIDRYPQHAGYRGDVLEHHHVGQGSRAVPLPSRLHDAHTVFHPQRRVVGTPTNGIRAIPPQPTPANAQAELDRHVRSGRIRGPGINQNTPPRAPSVPPASEVSSLPSTQQHTVTSSASPVNQGRTIVAESTSELATEAVVTEGASELATTAVAEGTSELATEAVVAEGASELATQAVVTEGASELATQAVVAEGASELATQAVTEGALASVPKRIISGAGKIGGMALNFVAQIAVNKALEWTLAKLFEAQLESDITNILKPQIINKLEQLESRIASLQGTRKLFIHITYDYIFQRDSPNGDPIIQLMQPAPPFYESGSMRLVGIHPGNEELDFPSDISVHHKEFLPLGKSRERVTVRSSYSLMVDDAPKRKREKENAMIIEKLRNNAPKTSTLPTQATTPFLSPPLLAPPHPTPTPIFDLLPGAPAMDRSIQDVEFLRSQMLRLLAKGEKLLSDSRATSQADIVTFREEVQKWHLIATYMKNQYHDKGPSTAYTEMDKILHDDKGMRVIKILDIFGYPLD